MLRIAKKTDLFRSHVISSPTKSMLNTANEETSNLKRMTVKMIVVSVLARTVRLPASSRKVMHRVVPDQQQAMYPIEPRTRRVLASHMPNPFPPVMQDRMLGAVLLPLGKERSNPQLFWGISKFSCSLLYTSQIHIFSTRRANTHLMLSIELHAGSVLPLIP